MCFFVSRTLEASSPRLAMVSNQREALKYYWYGHPRRVTEPFPLYNPLTKDCMRGTKLRIEVVEAIDKAAWTRLTTRRKYQRRQRWSFATLAAFHHPSLSDYLNDIHTLFTRIKLVINSTTIKATVELTFTLLRLLCCKNS